MRLTIECNLQKIRKCANLSQQNLADLADVKLDKIRQYENGQVTPSVYTLWKLAAVLECRPDEIYTTTEINREPLDLIK